jgi:hypothetical protein
MTDTDQADVLLLQAIDSSVVVFDGISALAIKMRKDSLITWKAARQKIT